MGADMDAPPIPDIRYIGGKSFDENAVYGIRNVNSSRCMDVYKSGTSDGTNVQQYGTVPGKSNNTWKLRDAGDGYYYIISQLSDGKTGYMTIENGSNTDMKKYLFSVLLTVFMLFTAFHIPIESTAEAVANTVQYTLQDIRNLQDFLLARPTEEKLSGKPYDLDNSGTWNVFDLCLMKRAYLSQHKTSYNPNFDLEKGTVMLNNGIEMPILGIGTYRLSNSQAENSVYWALRDGYRLIDTARIYGNEEGVGRGIQRAIDEGICTREEIFVTTKMWTSDYSNGENAIQASLNRLGLDYIDLMILHHSQPSNDVQAYQSMEKAVENGKLRSIGLSNYYTPEDFDRLVNATTIKPVLLQNETHPYHQSTEMKAHLQKYGTILESWYPLGGSGNTQRLFNDETISDIAQSHNKTSAQIILRWHLQSGHIAIPGSSNESHIQENCEIFDFKLSDEEMKRINNLDKNERFSTY